MQFDIPDKFNIVVMGWAILRLPLLSNIQQPIGWFGR